MSGPLTISNMRLVLVYCGYTAYMAIEYSEHFTRGTFYFPPVMSSFNFQQSVFAMANVTKYVWFSSMFKESIHLHRRLCSVMGRSICVNQ